MRHKFKIIADIFLSRNFLLFTLLGSFNTFTAATVSSLTSHFLQDNIAAIVGYLASISLSYFLNSRFVFRRKPAFKRYARFLISYVPTFIIYSLVTFVTINTWGLPQFWGTVLAAITGGPITFIVIKLYAFGKPKKEDI